MNIPESLIVIRDTDEAAKLIAALAREWVKFDCEVTKGGVYEIRIKGV